MLFGKLVGPPKTLLVSMDRVVLQTIYGYIILWISSSSVVRQSSRYLPIFVSTRPFIEVSIYIVSPFSLAATLYTATSVSLSYQLSPSLLDSPLMPAVQYPPCLGKAIPATPCLQTVHQLKTSGSGQMPLDAVWPFGGQLPSTHLSLESQSHRRTSLPSEDVSSRYMLRC